MTYEVIDASMDVVIGEFDEYEPAARFYNRCAGDSMVQLWETDENDNAKELIRSY